MMRKNMKIETKYYVIHNNGRARIFPVDDNDAKILFGLHMDKYGYKKGKLVKTTSEVIDEYQVCG